MPVRLNDHLLAPNEPKTPAVVPSGVNPSLGQVAPAISLDAINSRKHHGHGHVHDLVSSDASDETTDETSSDSTDVEDADPDCGDDDDCEENAIHIS